VLLPNEELSAIEDLDRYLCLAALWKSVFAIEVAGLGFMCCCVAMSE
jgi:hypothetical protein